MSDVDPAQLVHTRIWREEAEPDNPFAARAVYCRGYDVFGEMVGKARWVEMLFLLFRDELPESAALDMLEALAVALANPGPRDPSVHAAMCGGVGGSTAASSLIAALSVGAGKAGGAREIFDAMSAWSSCGADLESWQAFVSGAPSGVADIWPENEHPPGFDPNGVSTAGIVLKMLDTLSHAGVGTRITWLAEHRLDLEKAARRPLAMVGVAAAAFADLGFSSEEGEMLYLLLRLPGAAAHTLEQRKFGYKNFPFFDLELESERTPAES